VIGLSAREVDARRASGLGNAAPDDTGRSLTRIVVSHVITVFNGIVIGSTVLLLVLGAWQDALFGFFAVANSAIGIAQEFRAQRALARLAVLNASPAQVRRDGVDTECAVAELVRDDVLVLSPGEQVGADAVVLESRALEVDESLLTGEADPVDAAPGRELLSGSTIVAGSGLARVARVGADSYAARITADARRFALVESEIRGSLDRVIRWLSIALVPVGAVVVNGQMQAVGGWPVAVSTGAWREAAIASVANIIAMVPTGLVFMASLALAVGAVRLARGRVLVRELAAVEGFARVDMLCIDKTGTLTAGTMVLDRVEPVADAPDGWQIALASLAADPVANATSRAIAAEYSGATPPDAVVAFSSRHKWSAAHFGAGTPSGSWVLGGADVVFTGSRTGSAIRARASALAASGERTLVLARSSQPIPPTADPHRPSLPDGLHPVALLVFREEVRGDAAQTMAYFAEQGVEVCVISGDDPHTVAAVAHDVGLPTATGYDARDLPAGDAELAAVLRTERVFGRVTPEQKKRMILGFRSLGHTVAMIGDGVNDTLALKHADLGIAMGSGSPAARSVAHVVLLDSDLAELPRVVAEGRRVIANVERLAKLFLAKTIYAITFALTFGLLMWPFPFLPRQLSVVDGLTIGLPALVLALLPNASIARRGFLRRALRFCVPAGATVAAAVIAVVAVASAQAGTSSAQIHTLAVITLTLSALAVLTALARPLTRLTGVVVAGGFVGLVAVLAVPLARDFLHLELPPGTLLGVALAASGIAALLVTLLNRRGAARG
jgi:cation-transporting ATPase E